MTYNNACAQILRFVEYESQEIADEVRQGILRTSVSVFLYEFNSGRFYLNKTKQSLRFDPYLATTKNISSLTTAAVVKRCLGFELNQDTATFKHPEDQTLFLLSYGKYLDRE
jgi:hypothetical protein